MTPNENPIIPRDIPHVFFSSFEGKYNIVDNLDAKGDPVIPAHEETYNADNVYATYVLEGTLRIVVGRTELEVKANEYIAVTPCLNVTIKESRCVFFSFLTSNHIIGEIYERTGVAKKLSFHAFNFHYARFSPEQMQEILECYQRIKQEYLREDYPMKETVLRAYHGAYISKLFSFVNDENTIVPAKRSRQYTLFNEFIYKLNKMHQKERAVQYYASEMGVTPKYLSTVTQNFAGLTASQVIDQYVIFSIMQHLYTNDRNIKSLSQTFNFPSQSFFGRYFKRITKMSPNEYIKQHNIKSINFVQQRTSES